MDIIINEVMTKKDLKNFIKFPFLLYKNNKYWVPPLLNEEFKNLSKDKNPAFEYCEASYWLAYKDGKIVGRIAGILNKKYNEEVGKRIIRFCNLDFIDDHEVSLQLFKTIEEWANNLKVIISKFEG